MTNDTLSLTGDGPVAPAPGPHPPLFSSPVAVRKWDELQASGARMRRIEFDGGTAGAGFIDPWGKVSWVSPVAPAPSTGMEWRAPGGQWAPFDLQRCLSAMGYEGRFVTEGQGMTAPASTMPVGAVQPQRASDFWPPELVDALKLVSKALGQVSSIKADGSVEIHHQAARAVAAIIAGTKLPKAN